MIKILEENENVLINGDNLYGLALIEGLKNYDLILIDPPYRSGNKSFKYNDSLSKEEWIRFMYKRLEKAKDLLTEHGAIAIHIDDREYATLKNIMDDIFGEENYVNTLILKRTVKNINNQFKKVISLNRAFEFLLIYKKSNQFYYKNPFKPTNEKRKKGYWTSFKSNADRPTMRYDIGNISIDSGQWKWSKERGLRAFENYNKYLREFRSKMELREYWEKHKDEYEEKFGYPLEFVREYKKSAQYWVLPAKRTLMDTSMMEYSVAEKNGKKLYGFDTVKNLNTTKKIISMFTSENSNILDFFAGSGTTGHAVLELNKEDGGNRTFTLITNNEKNICSDICYPRIKKVSNENKIPFKYIILEDNDLIN